MLEKTNKIIKILLKENKLTQSYLAKHLNVTQASISRYLSGQMQMDIRYIIKTAQLFNVSTDFLLGLTDVSYLKSETFTEATDSLPQYMLITTNGLLPEDLEFINSLVDKLKDKYKFDL